MRKSKAKGLDNYSPDVLERLPYWVRELLKLLDEVKREGRGKVKNSLSK